MPKGKKTGGRNWKKGQSGNPRGPAVAPPDIRGARALTRVEFERVANKFLFSKKEEFQAAVRDPETPMLEMMIASIIQKGVIEGDERRMNFLLDRMVGKVVQPISAPDGSPMPVVQLFIPSNGREAAHINRGEAIPAESRHVRDGEEDEE